MQKIIIKQGYKKQTEEILCEAAASATALLKSLIGGGKSKSVWPTIDRVESIAESVAVGWTVNGQDGAAKDFWALDEVVWSTHDDNTVCEPPQTTLGSS